MILWRPIEIIGDTAHIRLDTPNKLKAIVVEKRPNVKTIYKEKKHDSRSRGSTDNADGNTD